MNKEPCAYFEGEFPHGSDWLAHTISDRLRLEFGASEVVRKWFVPRWVIEVEIGGTRFVVCLLLRQRYKWRLIFLLPSRSNFFTWGGNKQNGVSGIQAITGVVHALLSEMPDVTGLRWYLKGSGSSASTPEELSWG